MGRLFFVNRLLPVLVEGVLSQRYPKALKTDYKWVFVGAHSHAPASGSVASVSGIVPSAIAPQYLSCHFDSFAVDNLSEFIPRFVIFFLSMKSLFSLRELGGGPKMSLINGGSWVIG
jgi:hypothetical protein